MDVGRCGCGESGGRCGGVGRSNSAGNLVRSHICSGGRWNGNGRGGRGGRQIHSGCDSDWVIAFRMLTGASSIG